MLSGGGGAVRLGMLVGGMLSITGNDIITPPPREQND